MLCRVPSNDDESDIKSTDAEEVRERKEANIRTRATMASLRAKMEQVTRNKVSALRQVFIYLKKTAKDMLHH